MYLALMRSVYDWTCRHRKSSLHGIQSVAMTADSWDAGSTQRSFIGITCHYVDDDMRLISADLSLVPFDGRQTSVAIAEIVDQELRSYFSAEDVKLSFLVTDGASNYVNSQIAAGCEESIVCICHKLNLVVNDAFRHFMILPKLQLLRRITEKIARSKSIRQYLLSTYVHLSLYIFCLFLAVSQMTVDVSWLKVTTSLAGIQH